MATTEMTTTLTATIGIRPDHSFDTGASPMGSSATRSSIPVPMARPAASPSAVWIDSAASSPGMNHNPHNFAINHPPTAATLVTIPTTAIGRVGRRSADAPQMIWSAATTVNVIAAGRSSACTPMAAAWIAPAPRLASPATRISPARGDTVTDAGGDGCMGGGDWSETASDTGTPPRCRSTKA